MRDDQFASSTRLFVRSLLPQFVCFLFFFLLWNNPPHPFPPGAHKQLKHLAEIKEENNKYVNNPNRRMGDKNQRQFFKNATCLVTFHRLWCTPSVKSCVYTILLIFVAHQQDTVFFFIVKPIYSIDIFSLNCITRCFYIKLFCKIVQMHFAN